MESAALPAPLTSLVGRDAEVRAAGRLLAAAGHPLISLVGTAGSGKTRLAVAVAAAAAPPVWFVDLTTMRTGGHTDAEDPAGDAAGFVLDAFGAARRPDLDAVDTVGAILGEAPAVLLLDNCEHVTGPVAALAGRLLAAVPELRLLVTSRQPLGLPDETVVTVAPLDDDTALRLFETRMFERTGRPLPPAHRSGAAAICRALDGLPLAVELAAARAALLSVPEVHRLLTDRFRVLADAKATGPEHHRTLRAALDWSFELLSPDKQALLRQLAVFQGGWSQAAAAVLPAYRPGLLAALAERSLIDPQPAVGDARGRMLQTVAAYATARLAEVPAEAGAARDAHATFFLDLAEQAAAGIRGPGQRDLLRILTLEQDNLRAAMTWLSRRPGRAAAEDLRLATALAPFQHFTGVYRQGRDWLSDALGRRPDAPLTLRAAACSAAATLAMLDCDYATAAALAGAALALDVDDVRVRGRLLTLLGSVERERADYFRSRGYFEEALALYRGAGDAWGEGRAAQLAGATAWLSGDFASAGALLDASLAAFRDLADDESVAATLTHLGAVAHFGGDQPRARRHLVEALDRFTELSFPEGIGWAQDLLGRVDLADDAVASAAERLRASLSIHRRVGDRWRSASVLEAFAEARRRLDDPAHAAALLGAADVIRHEIGAPTPACELPARQETERALRATLPASAFDRAHRFGTRTPVDDLLDLSGSAGLTLAHPTR
ncbi:tetratricopeptide repeat protein [Dactylosporangium sp. NPDC049525]|uniref:ATP-binding protein n=1 Tax=Dactylosporangium sp. NPDC049525 TaxID=3154730 RepID=UPI00343C5216